MSSVRQELLTGREKLQACFENEPLDVLHFESSLLLAHALHCSRDSLIVSGDRSLSQQEIETFHRYIDRRCEHEPIAYITESQEFYSLDFYVNSDVLIPRSETELIVDLVLASFEKGKKVNYLVDVCCGSGAILLAVAHELKKHFGLELPAFGLDISEKACFIAEKNAERLGLSSSVTIIQSDLLTSLPRELYGNDIAFFSNPPYVPLADKLPATVEKFEPELALRAGSEGLDIYRRLLPEIAEWLAQSENSSLLLEIGIGQSAALECLASESNLKVLKFHEDLQGIKRVAQLGPLR